MNYLIRLVEEEDAHFIVSLRNNSKLNKNLNPTSAIVADQVNWIRNYKIREKDNKEFYFVIFENGIRRGVYRIYNINNVSATVGSWVFDSCENKHLSILTDLLIWDLVFYGLNKAVLLFDVRKDNLNVIKYISLKNPLLYSEDKITNMYLLKADEWESSKRNILTFFKINPNDYKIIKESYNTNNSIKVF